MAPEGRRLSSFLNNPCHNCRKRRLRCDRSRPTCFKCTHAGKECLGYDRLFIWTDGGAAQTGGGRVGSVNSSGLHSRRGSDDSSGGPGGDDSSPNTRGVRIKTEPFSPSSSDMLSPLAILPNLASDIAEDGPSEQHQELEVVPFMCGQHHRRMSSSSSTSSSCSLTSLTDPIFQDLDRLSRHYLTHFADRVCKDLVAYDTPSNPFRTLIPLAASHPFLLHILVATSAIHMSNISHPRLAFPSSIPSTPTSTSTSTSVLLLRGDTCFGTQLQYLRTTTNLARRCFLDGLCAKQRALEHLRFALDDPSTDGDVVLAAVLFFVNFELIDFGKSNWQTHLHGASEILSLLKPDGDGGGAGRLLRDCIVSDFVIYHILGSTLTSAGLALSIANHTMNLLPVLERVEANSYLCCPPFILRIILEASQLAASDPSCTRPETARRALALVRDARSFNIPAWARSVQPHVSHPDLAAREHVASAHRSAVLLYILRAVPSVREYAPVSAGELLDDILRRLSEVGEGDPLFKATSWPTFIAGAETTDPQWRAWALRRLLEVWGCCPWGYVVTAVEMLRETWRGRDGGDGEEVEGRGWLREVWDMDFGCLIV